MPTRKYKYKVIQVMITVTLYKCFVFTTKSKRIYTKLYTRCSRKKWRCVSQNEEYGTRELEELVSLLTEVCLIFRGRIHFVPGLGI